MFDTQEHTITIDANERPAVLNTKEIWEFRELLLFLGWRDLKVRYKQTVLGALWVVLQPVALMLIFTLVFGKFANLPSDGVPFHLFVLTGLVPWLLFSSLINQVSNSLIVDSRIISKIFFPRIIVPFSATISCLIDSLITLAVLLVVLVTSGWDLSYRLFVIPVLMAGTVLVALALSIGLAALNAKYRDFRFVIPFGLQLAMFLTPVFYSPSMVPDKLAWLYMLNPMVLVLEAFRWSVLGVGSISSWEFIVGSLVVTTTAVLSVRYFYSVEQELADLL